MSYYKFSEGLFAIYKPKGWTSAKVVNYIKKNSSIKNVGHGGTLDPFAEGVLVIGIGREFTKKLTDILKNSEKEYIAEIVLNQKSDTYDITGNIVNLEIKEIPTREKIESVVKSFIGEIEQYPPPYSAIKINGIRACDLLRRKKVTIEEMKKIIKPKKVRINNIEILDYNFPLLKLKINCMSGVYIRSLTNDLGETLNCGGMLQSLVRTQVSNFFIKDCIQIEDSCLKQ
ncbi:MAG: tRNA pseudouridine(55) synthase TruB [Endomicrobiia bacterium]